MAVARAGNIRARVTGFSNPHSGCPTRCDGATLISRINNASERWGTAECGRPQDQEDQDQEEEEEEEEEAE